MKIGLLDVDGHNFPNLPLMKISGYYKAKGHDVEWATPFDYYDIIYKAKTFTFTEDDKRFYNTPEIVKGGTGYDVKSVLPDEIEQFNDPDYSIYPMFDFSIQRFSTGCIRQCPFCIVNEKEGKIKSVKTLELNPNGKSIEVIDNNFFANPEWPYAVEYLNKTRQPVNLHGVDIRIMTKEQANAINSMKLKKNIHIAWDLPQIDLTDKLQMLVELIKPYKITCYVLVGFNSTIEQDMWRLNTLKSLGILPFVQPFRDYDNHTEPSQYTKDLARWANRAWLFKSMDFKDFKPRKNFCCSEYFK